MPTCILYIHRFTRSRLRWPLAVLIRSKSSTWQLPSCFWQVHNYYSITRASNIKLGSLLYQFLARADMATPILFLLSGECPKLLVQFVARADVATPLQFLLSASSPRASALFIAIPSTDRKSVV